MSARIRQTPHIEGNFATCVVIELGLDNANVLRSFITQAASILHTFSQTVSEISHLHLSLSRHVFLKPHLIDSFLSKIGSAFSNTRASTIYLSPEVRVYLNESRDTAFAAVPVDIDVSRNCLSLIRQVDSVMAQFDLPTYYENPSPHVSLASASNPAGFPSEFSSHCSQLENVDLDELCIDVDKISVYVGNTVHAIYFS